MILRVLVLLILICPAISDIRYRSFHIGPPALFFAAAFVIRIYGAISGDDVRGAVMAVLAGLLPGIILGVLSRLSRGAVGDGDGLIVLFLGAILGFYEVLSLCILALVLCGAVGMGMIVFKGGSRKTALPFLPFLLVSYLLFMICI